MAEPTPGPELDLAVARALYGRPAIVRTADGRYIRRAPGQEWGSAQPIPPYSTVVAAAVPLIERFWSVQIGWCSGADPGWDVALYQRGNPEPVVEVTAETLPLAICRAALQAAAAGEGLTAGETATPAPSPSLPDTAQ